jgi:hypothetical protein
MSTSTAVPVAAKEGTLISRTSRDAPPLLESTETNRVAYSFYIKDRGKLKHMSYPQQHRPRVWKQCVTAKKHWNPSQRRSGHARE